MREESRARLLQKVVDSTAVHDLAGNPLLLTMMSIINRTRELPNDRASLYKGCAHLLLYQWKIVAAVADNPALDDMRRDLSNIDPGDKEKLLCGIAYEMQSGPSGLSGNLIGGQRLVELLERDLPGRIKDRVSVARILRDQLRTRNFILCYRGGNVYGFIHRTFLEYFCALEIYFRFTDSQTLSFESLRDEIFGKYWMNATWHEVLRLIVALINPSFAGRLIQFLLNLPVSENDPRPTLLAGRCVSVMRSQTGAEVAFQATWNKLTVLAKNIGGTSYQSSDDPNEMVSVGEQELRNQAFNLIVGAFPLNRSTLEWLGGDYLNGRIWSDELIRVLDLMFDHWPDDPITHKAVVRALAFKGSAIITTAAISLITEIENLNLDDSDKSVAVRLLKDTILSDQEANLRAGALALLVRFGPISGETADFIRLRSEEDPELQGKRPTNCTVYGDRYPRAAQALGVSSATRLIGKSPRPGSTEPR